MKTLRLDDMLRDALASAVKCGVARRLRVSSWQALKLPRTLREEAMAGASSAAVGRALLKQGNEAMHVLMHGLVKRAEMRDMRASLRTLVQHATGDNADDEDQVADYQLCLFWLRDIDFEEDEEGDRDDDRNNDGGGGERKATDGDAAGRCIGYERSGFFDAACRHCGALKLEHAKTQTEAEALALQRDQHQDQVAFGIE